MNKHISPLWRLTACEVRKLCAGTHRGNIRSSKRFADFLKRSLVKAGVQKPAQITKPDGISANSSDRAANFDSAAFGKPKLPPASDLHGIRDEVVVNRFYAGRVLRCQA